MMNLDLKMKISSTLHKIVNYLESVKINIQNLLWKETDDTV